MNIEFSGKSAQNPETFGISFEALVDGAKVICQVSTEALQDIDPSNAMNEPTVQFSANQYLFQEIAEALILEGKVQNGQLFISSSDVRA
jgi:Protein of unknown function (DUF1488)